MRELSETFSDRIIFLIFGKVNAGKSSFCNFFVDTVDDKMPQYFYLKDGQIKTSKEPFKEGVTETTARIQGIELNNKLILLDTPGLHSVTGKNEDLTRRYTDSADAVIWLTSSHSPGQVQELNDLKAEIQKKKPLLPVISKSDYMEEDVDDKDDIVKIMKVKSPKNRQEQEDDVKKRTVEGFTEHGQKDTLKAPISISVQYCKKNASSTKALEESGINRLFSELIPIIDDAVIYKANKASQQIINYLEGEVLRTLKTNLVPAIEKLQISSSDQITELNEKKDQISTDVINDILLSLPDLIEQYKNDKDTKGLSREIEQKIRCLINSEIEKELNKYIEKVGNALSSLHSVRGGLKMS